MTQAISTGTFCEAKWVVDPTAGQGTHTTIATALTSASSGDTIFIRPGTYTENLTLKAGVNLCSFSGEGKYGQVTILGTVTASYAGSATITGIRLQTNGATALSVSGASLTNIALIDCDIDATNATGMTINNSSSNVLLLRCSSLVTATFVLYTATAVASLLFSACYMNNSSTAVSNVAAGTVFISNSYMEGTYSTSSTGILDIRNCFISVIAATAITTAGTGSARISNSTFYSTSASAVSVGSGTVVTMINSNVNSSNTNAITGSGTLIYGGLIFEGSSSTVNTSTQTKLINGPVISTTGLTFDGGTNTMSAYTVGTFSPTLVGNTIAGTTTYSSQNGYYVRIGAFVNIIVTVQISSATGTGTALIGSFPFTIKNQTNGSPQGSIIGNNAAGWTWVASTTSISLYGVANTTNAQIYGTGSGAATGPVQMANAAALWQTSLNYQI